MQELKREQSSADKLTKILASAKLKQKANRLPDPTINEIDAFIESVRDECIKSKHDDHSTMLTGESLF